MSADFKPKSEALRVLQERGYIHQVTDAEALDAAFNAGVVTAYVGYDCTADSLHIGSLISIMMLRWLQKTGHRPIALMGGGTTKVGDPTDKDQQRPLLTDAVINANLASIKGTFQKFLTLRRQAHRRGDGQQRRLAGEARLRRVPARVRRALHDQPHADVRTR